jgi:hypothetical protein
MDGIQENEYDFDTAAMSSTTVQPSVDVLDTSYALASGSNESEEATSHFNVDDEISFMLPESTLPAVSVAPTTLESTAAVLIPAKRSLRARLASCVTNVTNNRGLLEVCCAAVVVEDTSLHVRIEKKASSLAGAISKLISIDPEFKGLCKDFADKFESYSGVYLKSRVLDLLDILQDSYELTDDQSVFTILMIATSRLRKRGDKSLQNASMTLRILGSVISASDVDLPGRFARLEAGFLEGDLSGGDRSGVLRFALGHPSDSSNRLFVAWLGFMSHLSELDSALATEKKKFFMVSGVRHSLWQQISSEGRLENIQVCFARFLEARDNFSKFQSVLEINLLPSDAFGLLSLFWPAMFKDFKEEVKAAVRMKVKPGSLPVRWLQNIPVFKSVKEYEDLFRMAWALYSSGGDRRVAAKDRPAPAAASSASNGSGQSSAQDQKSSVKVCKHFKKFGICKFGDSTKCRNGSHPAEFKKSSTDTALVPDLPAPLPPTVLAAGGSDNIVKDCRRCKLPFTESEKYWMGELKLDCMPAHCKPCRLLNKEDKSKKSASVAAVPVSVPESVPDVTDLVVVDGDDSPVVDHWDEILHYDDNGEDFQLMVSVEAEADDSVSIMSVSGAWKSDLNNIGLRVQSITVKSVFDEDMKHFDRMCCHLGTERVVQICVSDKESLLAVDSEDLIELCIPGSAIGCHDSLSLDSLPVLLHEQAGIDVDKTRFKFVGYSELSDHDDSRSVWYYFEVVSAYDDEFADALTEEGGPVSWLESFQWKNMNDLRAAESSVYFELKSARIHDGFEVDVLDSDEFAYAMGVDSDDAVAVATAKSGRFSPLRCRMCDGSKADAGECDGVVCEFGGCSVCCGEFGCDCITFEPDSDSVMSSDVDLDAILPSGVPEKFEMIIPLVLKFGFVCHELDEMFASGRAWLVRLPSAKRAIRDVLAITEARTSLRRVDELSALVPIAVGWIRQGCPDEDLSHRFMSGLHEFPEHCDDRRVSVDTFSFSKFDFDIVASAATGLAEFVVSKQRERGVASLSSDLSKMALVCSGLHRDVKQLATCDGCCCSKVGCDFAAEARKIGVKKQLTLRESLLRASRSVMFEDPSYVFVGSQKSGFTGTDILAKASPFFGRGSAEPRE